MFRNRKSHKRYDKHNQVGCPFCESYKKPRLIKATTHAQVVKSDFPYDFWEGKDVLEHLMVLPKRHVASLQELKDEELLDVMKLIAEYEADNYNVYARGVANATRSVVHQHTHLIKATNTEPKMYIYIPKPYFVHKI
jgi:diadenosine tetraphosphate (Ap4A) HIT family hydrolase